MDNDRWYVIYTRARHEKNLANQLEEAGYTVYLPLVTRQRKWSDRTMKIEMPLFNSYVFIKGVCEKSKFRDFRSFVKFLEYEGRPAVVKQKEIDILKSIIKHGYDVREAGSLEEFTTGSQVQVIGGPLKGSMGTLISVDNKECFRMEFHDMGNAIIVFISPRFLQRINE